MNQNLTVTQNQRQGLRLPPPPSKPRKRKAPEDCYSSFIDEIQDGLYGGSKLVRSTPRKTSDTYFIVRTFKESVRSYRRNYSHKNVALFRNKKDGPTRANIEYLTCSFLEMDGSTDRTIKTKEDVFTLIAKNNLPTESYVNKTSSGNFHVIWTYDNPLPWTTKNESYWTAQQKRLIQSFQKAGFNVDTGASLNPVQNLRNPSQLRPFNFKRRCQVEIHRSYKKTSLRAIYRALNKTSVPNPKRLPASTKLRRYLRQNKTFTGTQKELAKRCGVSERTIGTEVQKAIKNGDLQIVQRTGNNKRIRRTTEYFSTLYIEPNFQNGNTSINTINSLKGPSLLTDFQDRGARKGYRNKTIFVLVVGLSCESDQTLTVREIADQLRGGSLRSGLSEKELVRTIKNAVKPIYCNPFSLPKMKEWGLLERRKITEILH